MFNSSSHHSLHGHQSPTPNANKLTNSRELTNACTWSSTYCLVRTSQYGNMACRYNYILLSLQTKTSFVLVQSSTQNNEDYYTCIYIHVKLEKSITLHFMQEAGQLTKLYTVVINQKKHTQTEFQNMT